MKTLGTTVFLTSLTLLLVTFSVPPAAAVGACTTVGGLTCTVFYCQAGETLRVTVSGVGSGSITGCGTTASCSALVSCSASARAPTGFNSWATCAGSIGTVVTCSSS